MLAEFPYWFLALVAIPLGLAFGSFLNVVIYRLPRGESVVHPGSRCPGCGKPIRGFDNIPVFSWLLLRGRSRCCKTKISPRYPLVELLGGLSGWASLQKVLEDAPADASLVASAALFAAYLALTLGLIAAIFIDLDFMLLPDEITLGGAVLGLITAPMRHLPWTTSLLGAAIGFAIVWLPFVFLYGKLRGRPGMGLGDAKLVMLAGAWFGWPGAAFTLFGGAVQASLGAIGVLLVHGRIEEPEAVKADREELERAAAAGDAEAAAALADDPLGKPPEEGLMAARMPFGPFLCLGIIEWMLGGAWVVERFFTF